MADNFLGEIRIFSGNFAPNGWAYLITEAVLIIVFTFFYTSVQFNPVDQADNLRKYGGYIPGVRPGRPTAEFLEVPDMMTAGRCGGDTEHPVICWLVRA